MPEIIYKIAVNSENINLNLLNILTLLSVKKSGSLKICIKNNLTLYKRHDILYKYVEKTKQSYTLTSAHVLMRLGFIYRSTAVNAVDVT